MDTINKIATAASEAIWGENKHEEPVSGKLGNVAAGEPYDAGNIGEPNEDALSPAEKRESERVETPSTTAKQTQTPVSEVAKPAVTQEEAEKQVRQEHADKQLKREEQSSQQETINPADVPLPSATPTSTMRDDSTKAKDTTTTSTPGTGTGIATSASPSTTTPGASATAAGAAAPTTTKPSETTKGTATDAQDKTKTQAAEATAAQPQPKRSASGDAENAPVKIEGPGPRPLEEVAREHGGDAGAAGATRNRLPGEEEGEWSATQSGGVVGKSREGQGQERRRDSAKGLGDEEGEGFEGKGKGMGTGGGGTMGEGTGEEYIKSTGLHAEGGDFDASRAGAGREADRLLEEKGMAHPGGQPGDKQQGAAAGEGGHKEKTGLKSKIKAKLHKSTMST